MKNIFIFVLCFSVLSGSVFAESKKKVELQKRVAELTAKRDVVVGEMNVLTAEYRGNVSKIAKMKLTARAGKDKRDKYDKTDVDSKTAKLIDRCVAARDKHLKLEEELHNRLAKSKEGIARAEKFDKALEEVVVVKQVQSELIKKRALVGQEVRVVVKELDKARLELKLLEEAEAKASEEESKNK